MANNRLYIGCRECREYMYLDKHFGGPFTITEETKDNLNCFLDKHAYCGRNWAISFELFDENTDDPKTWDYYVNNGFRVTADELTEV